MISVCKNANGSVTTIQYVKFEMEKKRTTEPSHRLSLHCAHLVEQLSQLTTKHHVVGVSFLSSHRLDLNSLSSSHSSLLYHHPHCRRYRR